MSRSDDEVLRFVAASFPSVWALELTLVIKQERRPWTRADLNRALRASDIVVSKAIDALVAAGIASIDEDAVSYLPVNADVGDCLDRVEQLYRTRPNQVRRVIIAATQSGAAAFAAAFKLRGEGK